MAVRVLILGTGLIGASMGLALKALGPQIDGTVLGWDVRPAELETALASGAIDEAVPDAGAVLSGAVRADVYVLAMPVLPILDWMRKLAPVLQAGQLVTDVGSTKREIVSLARALYGGEAQATFLPSHPMAGKELGGAALADAELFRGAAWLFTPLHAPPTPLEARWRGWIEQMGVRSYEMEAEEHDRMCAWVSHLPQMLSTALASLLQETFAGDAHGRAVLESIGGRALRETTRLGASPYSMWRDIALTNTEPIAATLYALEQKLAHLRENLRTPELREEFHEANRFRMQNGPRKS